MDDESGSAVVTLQESHDTRNTGKRKSRELAVVPLKLIPQALEILRSVLDASRKEVHAAIDEALVTCPGHRRREALNCVRWLRRNRGDAHGRHVVWSEEDVQILRAGYAEGLAGIRRARKTLLERHRDWNECVIDYKAAELGITKQRPATEGWTELQGNALLVNAEETSVRQIACKLSRTESAVRTQMSLRGLGTRVRSKRGCTFRGTAYIFGIGHTTVCRYVAKGLLHASKSKNGCRTVYISYDNIEKFYLQYPEKVKNPERTREMIDLWHYDGEDAEDEEDK